MINVERSTRKIIGKDSAIKFGEEYVNNNSGFDSAVTGVVVNTKSIELNLNRTFYYSIVDESATLLSRSITIRHQLKISALNGRVNRSSYKVIRR